MGWISAEALIEEGAPLGIWSRDELEGWRGSRVRSTRARDDRIREAKAQGDNVPAIARTFGVSEKTVYRALERRG